MAIVAEHQVTLSGTVDTLKGAESGQPRRFRMVAYTGAEVTRSYGRAIADLSGISIPSKLPILLNHDENSVVGYADKAELTERGLELSGQIIEDEPAGKRVATLSDRGFPLTASIGARIERVEKLDDGKTAKCNGRDVSGPLTVWRQVSLFETSFVTSNPADKNTSAAALGEEPVMTPEEFAAANPAAVTAWKADAAKAEREALMGRLDSLLKAVPDRTSFVLAQFLAGADVVTAKAALSDVLTEELKAAKAAPAAPVAAPAPQANATLDALKAKADHPGLGFGPDRQEPENTANLAPADRARVEFARDPAARAAFGSEAALAAYYKAEAAGLVSTDVVNRAAGLLRGAPTVR
jgi:phage head maturation protease